MQQADVLYKAKCQFSCLRTNYFNCWRAIPVIVMSNGEDLRAASSPKVKHNPEFEEYYPLAINRQLLLSVAAQW